MVDPRDDTLKYLLILQLLLENAAQIRVQDAFSIATVNEAAGFFSVLSNDFLKGEYRDLTHDIFHYFAQVFVEQGYPPNNAIRALRVTLFLSVKTIIDTNNRLQTTG